MLTNEPHKGLRWFNPNVLLISKMPIIDLSQLGQDLFDFSDLT